MKRNGGQQNGTSGFIRTGAETGGRKDRILYSSGGVRPRQHWADCYQFEEFARVSVVHLATGGMGDWPVLSRHGRVRVYQKIGDQGADD